jgi:glycosyltransferase involved in cell wall biosynthesis
MKLGLNGRYRAARLTGVQRFAHGLCDVLLERTDAVLFLPADAGSAGVPAHVTVKQGVLRGHAWEQLELPGMVRAAGVDVLLNPANSGPWSGDRHALMVHDVLPLTHPHWFARRYALWQKHALRSALRRASHVFTSTEHTAGQIVRVSGMAAQRVHVITQGLHPFHSPAADAEVDAVRERFAVRLPYFLFVGLGDPRKNIELLLSAAAQLQTQHEFLVVAVGRRTSRIHGWRSDRLSALPWLRVVEQVSDAELRALYTGSVALCFPSLAEGFGRPPLEALACGAPALVGDYAAARELLGTTVPILPYDRAAWAEQMGRLLSEPDQRARLTEQASVLLEQFDWGRAAEQVLLALQANTTRVKVPA